MDDGRIWALETFGAYGPQTRERIAKLVRDEHEASLDAQEASGHRSQGVYGEFWRGILEKFESLGRLPGATLVRPGDAPYKIPVINGVALFPWRYAKNREAELATVPFNTSEARMAITRLRPPAVQEAFDLGLPDDGLSAEERELLVAFQSTTRDPAVTSGRLVLVAISSSVRGLFSVEWGNVQLGQDGFVEWDGFHESLLSMPPTKSVAVVPTGTFTAGDLPSKFPEQSIDEKADVSTDA